MSRARDRGPLGDAHEHDDRAAHAGECFPVGLVLVAEPAVTGDDGDARRHPALRDRHPCGGRCGDRRGDAGHDLERHARGLQRECLLAAASEEERVAALQPHHAPMTLRAAGRADR